MVAKTIVEYPVQSSEVDIKNIKKVELSISKNKAIYLIHRAMIGQLQERRQGSAKCKTRSEVRGGGRKPWKQKGTGKARVGSIRSPLWKGGGVIFGPSPKKYITKINIKEKQLALRTLLFNKAECTYIINNTSLEMPRPSTKALQEKLISLGQKKAKNILIVIGKQDKNLYLSSRNLSSIEIIHSNNLNIISLLKAEIILLTIEGLSQLKDRHND